MHELTVIAKLLGVIAAYDNAATRFLDKCDQRKAFSKETRRELTQCIELSRSVVGQLEGHAERT